MIGDEDEKYEFLTYGVQQRTRLMAMRVPMKWFYSLFVPFSFFLVDFWDEERRKKPGRRRGLECWGEGT